MRYLKTAASCSSRREHSRQPGEEGTCRGRLAYGDRWQHESTSSTACCPTWPLNTQFLRAEPCAVRAAGDKCVDEEFVAIAGSDVERSVAVLVHAVNLPTWSKMFIHAEDMQHVYALRDKMSMNETHRFEWGFGSAWSGRELLSCEEDSSHHGSEKDVNEADCRSNATQPLEPQAVNWVQFYDPYRSLQSLSQALGDLVLEGDFCSIATF